MNEPDSLDTQAIEYLAEQMKHGTLDTPCGGLAYDLEDLEAARAKVR